MRTWGRAVRGGVTAVFLCALVIGAWGGEPGTSVLRWATGDATTDRVAGETRLPASLAPVLAASLAADAGDTYRVAAGVGGVPIAPNPRHGYATTFTEGGVRLTVGDGAGWGLRLAAAGRGDVPGAVAATAPVVSGAHRVEYRRGDLTEWYVNGPMGLEQGFTLVARPVGAGELTFVLALDGAAATGGGNGATLALAGGGTLRYGGLRAWDAEGRELPARLAGDGNVLRVAVDDAGAAYPVTVDPFIQQAKLLASDRATNDWFGFSVALSADGNTALVGARYEDAAPNADNGAAYVFTRSGTTWNQQTKLLASDRADGDEFGFSVALSADGNTALVGARVADAPLAGNCGAAYVFTRGGTMWTQQAKLQAADRLPADVFGHSVALSADGNTALVGANEEDTAPAAQNGAAYVFVRGGTTWTEQAKLIAPDRANGDYFGYSVALSGDGHTALVGAYLEDTAPLQGDNGAAYVFVRTGTTWTQQTKLLAADRADGDAFGTSVALSADGNTALVGAWLEDTAPFAENGAAYVFVRSGTAWAQQAKLLAADGSFGDLFGYSVALSADGAAAMIGAYGESTAPTMVNGAAYVFTRSGTTWTQQGKSLADDLVTSDYFGYAVALSGDGTTALAGAYREGTAPTSLNGAVYVLLPPAAAAPTQRGQQPSGGGVPQPAPPRR